MTNADKTKDTWDWEIKPQVSWFSFNIAHIVNNRELIWSFTRRDLQSTNNQTVLGNIWTVLLPLFTTLVYLIVFGNIIKLSTNGSPPLLFYLTGNMLWTYFADCLFGCMFSFKTNAHILEKVYFPRILLPLSSILTHSFRLSINFIFFIGVLIYYHQTGESSVHIKATLFFTPILLVSIALYALAWGLLVFVITAKYKDFENLVHFALRLYMFITPVFYPVSIVSKEFAWAFWLNPLTAIFESFRACYTDGIFLTKELSISLLVIFVFYGISLTLFKKAEIKVMDVL